MNQKKALLRELELSHCGDTKELDQQFRTLIKRYHPDRNTKDTDWANQKSHLIIDAYKKLKPMIHSQSRSPYVRKQYTAPTYTPKKENVSIAFQILKGEMNFAIPVNKIHKIIFSDCKKIEQGNVLWIKNIYPDECEPSYKHKDNIDWQEFKYLILLNPESKKRALAISDKIEIAGIKKIDIRSAGIYPSHDLSGIYIKHMNFSCFCPEDLAFNEFISRA